MPYPNSSGVLATAGGIVVTALLDGTIMALDDQTLEELWSINVGTGIDAPPMTYAVDGKQYIAIATGLTRNQVGKLAHSPETKDLGQERDHDLRVRFVRQARRDHGGSLVRTKARVKGSPHPLIPAHARVKKTEECRISPPARPRGRGDLAFAPLQVLAIWQRLDSRVRGNERMWQIPSRPRPRE